MKMYNEKAMAITPMKIIVEDKMLLSKDPEKKNNATPIANIAIAKINDNMFVFFSIDFN